MTGVPTRFEPRYYERAAQRYLALSGSSSVWANVPWGTHKHYKTRPEVDAILKSARGHLVAVEVKSHSLVSEDVAEIVAKYASLGFRELLIVAPRILKSAIPEMRSNMRLNVEVEEYRPNPDEIFDWYQTFWPQAFPDAIREALATGRHHLRAILSAREERQPSFVIGQQRSRIYTPEAISRWISTMPWPPARILWTPQRFTIPRDVIARRSRLTMLGGYVPVDIDGDRLHKAFFACELDGLEAKCDACLTYAARVWRALAAKLPFPAKMVFWSGGRGIHAYFEDRDGARERILQTARTEGLRIDEPVTAVSRATVSLPGSLHAGTMRPVANLARGGVELTTC